ncbi:zinc-binding dehydrogenase [Rhodovulum sp. 12E13]|uniref:zinc-binding dehydrogenase n=1 Tax=Rhodovulum sp. 12E13 TaxID=2203891 RepID=UPI000E1A2133|nr:zinc-binding dehydrogenase [Rhodovulum sp. 12E13]RDC73661.1 zinc-binding dehydrogenase [Rhodovulum sp. 12E13]
MKAMVLHAHGEIGDIEWHEDWPDPEPGEGEVLVRVAACALNYHDLFTLRGMPGIKVPMPIIMGIDASGTVAGTGPGVEGWAEGDRVLIDPIDRESGRLFGEMVNGGLAEYAVVKAHQLVRLPDSVGFESGAALPCAYGTAYRMMVTRGQVAEGEKVLILGASGGVGTCCVQLARMAGAHVIAAASSPEKLAKLESLGADEVIDYTERLFRDQIVERHGKPRIAGGGGVDVVVNFTGGETWVPSLRSLKRHGRMLTCGATAGYDPKTDIRFIWTFEQQIVGSNGWERADVEALLALVDQGRLTPVIDRTHALPDAHAAFSDMAERRIFGKVLVAP